MTCYSMSSQSCFCLSAINHLPVSHCRSLNSNEGRRCHCKLLAVSPPEGACSAYLSAPEELSVNVLQSDSWAWQQLHQQRAAFFLGDGQTQVSSWGSLLPWLCYCSCGDWKRENWLDPSASLRSARLSKVQAGSLGQGLELAPADIPAQPSEPCRLPVLSWRSLDRDSVSMQLSACQQTAGPSGFPQLMVGSCIEIILAPYGWGG